MATTTYNDGLKAGGRWPQLWFIAQGKIYPFTGQHISGIVVVMQNHFSKCGKWSSTSYELRHQETVVAIHLLAPLHGKTWEQATWDQGLAWLCEQAGQPIEMDHFREVIRQKYEKTAERWDETERMLKSV